MKKTALSMIFVLMFALVPMMSFAAEATIEGSVQGYNCVTQGTTCPAGKEDPMAGIEQVFVVLTGDNEFYFVPNVDRAILARHINERIKVTGELNDKYNSINATKIESLNKGLWVRSWGSIDELDLLKDLNLGGAF